MWDLYSIIRPALFALPPESAHRIVLSSLSWSQRLGFNLNLLPKLNVPINFLGMDLKNPIALAAGLDKNGDYVKSLIQLGFGMVEIGTVTPLAQLGNPSPRLFRLSKAKALINRMGFNNLGCEYAVQKLTTLQPNLCDSFLGVNIGKNASTPFENAITDYQIALSKVIGVADYVTINISSPNTKNLRDLQNPSQIKGLLAPLIDLRDELDFQYKAKKKRNKTPLLVKISPDLNLSTLYQVLDAILLTKVDGIIATNTTVQRENVRNIRYAQELGGLSGAPLTHVANGMMSKIRLHVGKTYPLVASGGIMSNQDVLERFEAGANVVQLYTGLIFRGALLLKEIAPTLDMRFHH